MSSAFSAERRQQKFIMDSSLSIQKYDASYKKRKKVVLAGLTAIIILCLVWIAIPLSMAKELSDPDDQSEWSNFHKTYYNFQQSVDEELADGMFNSINALFGDETEGNIVNKSLSSVKASIEESKLFMNVATALKGIAMFIVVVYSMFHMFAELQRGDGSTDMWAKCFVTVAIGLMVVMNWDAILTTLEQLGQYLMTKVGEGVDKTENLEGIRTWVDSTFAWGDNDMNDLGSYAFYDIGGLISGFFENALLYFWGGIRIAGMFIILVIFEIPLMGARIVLLTILIELYVRKAFFPLAIADVAGNGARSPGIGYMKKFVALYIRIGMCYLIAAIGNIIVNAVMGADAANFLEGLLKIIVVFVAYLTCTKLYSSTSSIASQVVGY